MMKKAYMMSALLLIVLGLGACRLEEIEYPLPDIGHNATSKESSQESIEKGKEAGSEESSLQGSEESSPQGSEESSRETSSSQPDQQTEKEGNGYTELLSLYKAALEEGWDEGKCIENQLVSSIYRPYWLEYTDDILSREGFAFYDLDGDGTDELLLGWVGNEFWNMDDGYFFACYTMKNGEVTLALEGWERNQYVLGEDGSIYCFSSGGAADSSYRKAVFDVTDDDFLMPVEELSSRQDGSQIRWEYITGPEETGDSENQGNHDDSVITEEEANTKSSSWMDSGRKLEYTLFSDYK